MTSSQRIRGIRLGLVATTTLLALRLCAAASSPAGCSAALPLPLREAAAWQQGACDLPIDDTVRPLPASYSPWTHLPVCEEVAGIMNAGDGTHVSKKKKFCVFTNSRHGARGLSIVSTPETAADSAGVLDQEEGFSAQRGNETAMAATTMSGGPFRLADIPGKGKGVVATRPIRRYELIMVDYSVLLVDMALATELAARRGYRLLHLATDQLPDRRVVWDLGQTNDMARDPVENVMRTNAFHTMLGDVPHMALYPDLSVWFSLLSTKIWEGG